MVISAINLEEEKETCKFNSTLYPDKHILAGLPLFTAPIRNKKTEEKTVHMSSINDIITRDTSKDGRKLVFAGKIIKKAGDNAPFSMESLIKTHQAGLV